MRFLSIILLTISLLLETTIITIPLVLLSLICLIIIYKENILFLFAFVFGLFLDLILFNTVGASSLFFIIFMFLILLYQRKFEIQTASFVLVSSLFGSFLYLFLIHYNSNLPLQAIMSSFLGLIIFKLLQRANANKVSN